MVLAFRGIKIHTERAVKTMIKSRHMYFVIATMALGYTSTASAVKLSHVNGHWAHISNTADEVPCAACSPKTQDDFSDTTTWTEWWAGFLDDTSDEHGEFSCTWQTASQTDYIFPIGTQSETYDGRYYDCTSSGWVLHESSTSLNGTFDRNGGTIYNGKDCEWIADNGQYYQCSSCSSVSCNDGYYGNPTNCRVTEYDCTKCPDSSYKKALGGSGSFACTSMLQAGQSTAGSNRTSSGCKIPRFYGGSDGAYCNDNGFFIWDSECSYAG